MCKLESHTVYRLIEGIRQIKDGSVEVVVANPGPDTVTLPAATQIVTVQEVTATDQVVILPTSEKLTVYVQQVMVESSDDASLPTRLLQSSQPRVDEINTSPVVFFHFRTGRSIHCLLDYS